MLAEITDPYCLYVDSQIPPHTSTVGAVSREVAEISTAYGPSAFELRVRVYVNSNDMRRCYRRYLDNYGNIQSATDAQS